MPGKFTIYGERCSGTNYLEGLITQNFNATVDWSNGWKHFFGFNDLSIKENDDILFIGIVRNPVDWLNSLYKIYHHLPSHLIPKKLPPMLQNNNAAKCVIHNYNAYHFLNDEFWSIKENGTQIMFDRHIYEKRNYINIFEMRHTKMQFLVEDMPKKVKHFILIRYEDLMDDFVATMNYIKTHGKLEVKNNDSFPTNIYTYKAVPTNAKFKKKLEKPIPDHRILRNPKLRTKYEKHFKYIV